MDETSGECSFIAENLTVCECNIRSFKSEIRSFKSNMHHFPGTYTDKHNYTVLPRYRNSL